MANQVVTGELYEVLTGQIFEIARQLRQKSGYPFDPLALKAHLQAAIEGNFAVSVSGFPTWKAVELGRYPSSKQLCEELATHKIQVSVWAADILNKVKICPEAEIELVRATPRELGFRSAARYDAICFAARERGLELCPAEVGPALRLDYLDQPLGEWLVVAMEPLTGSGGSPNVWGVGCYEGGLWLNANYGDPDDMWGDGDSFVFARRT